MKIIVDQFSSLEVSPQRRYQLRHAAAGRCRLCHSKQAPGSPFCRQHQKKQRLWCEESRARKAAGPAPAGDSSSTPANPADLI